MRNWLFSLFIKILLIPVLPISWGSFKDKWGNEWLKQLLKTTQWDINMKQFYFFLITAFDYAFFIF